MPIMENNNINLKKIDKMAGLAFKNGIRLHFDSIELFKNNSFPSAYFLSILAIEEIGKSFMLMNFLRHSYFDEEYFKYSYSHTVKQFNFALNLLDYSPKNKLFKTMTSGQLEKFKQNAMYVSLSRNKGKIILKSKINNPFKINRNKTFDQITNINDCLLDLTLGTIKQVYWIESKSAESLLNKRLFSKLKNKWWYIKRKTKLKLKKIESV